MPTPGTRRGTTRKETAAPPHPGLTAEPRARLDELLPVGAATGDRYQDMSHLDR